MRSVIIPFNYEALSAAEQDKIVPIFIPALDKKGVPIARGWFEAAARLHKPLLKLCRWEFRDERRVSEVAEGAVHGVWHTHGDDFGRSPDGRLYTRAKWVARDFRAGGKSQRNGLTVSLEEIDRLMRMKLEVDPTDYASKYCRSLDLGAISDGLSDSGEENIATILDLFQDGKNWIEMAEQTGVKPDTLRKRFNRWLARKSNTSQRLLEILR